MGASENRKENLLCFPLAFILLTFPCGLSWAFVFLAIFHSRWRVLLAFAPLAVWCSYVWLSTARMIFREVLASHLQTIISDPFVVLCPSLFRLMIRVPKPDRTPDGLLVGGSTLEVVKRLRAEVNIDRSYPFDTVVMEVSFWRAVWFVLRKGLRKRLELASKL